MSSATNIMFCGAPRGELGHLAQAAMRRPMAVVLLGDIESPPIRDIVRRIAGNRDTDRPGSWQNMAGCVAQPGELDDARYGRRQ